MPEANKLLGNPRVIDRFQLQFGQWVRPVRVEASRDNDQLGGKGIKSGQQGVAPCAPEFSAAAARREGNIRNIVRTTVFIGKTSAWIAGTLMARGEEEARFIRECRLGSITVMHIKVGNGDPSQAPSFPRMAGSDRDAVEQTEPHCPGWLSVMSRWPDCDERRACPTTHNQVDGVHRSAASPKSCFNGVATNHRVRIKWHDLTGCRPKLEDSLDVDLVMNAHQIGW